MIALCRARYPDQRWLVADMRALDLAGVFEIVIAWDSRFHLTTTDQRRMFERFARHTAPGGVSCPTTGPEAGTRVGSMFGEPLYHASLSPTEYTRVLADSGYGVVEHRREDPSCENHTIWHAVREAPD